MARGSTPVCFAPALLLGLGALAATPPASAQSQDLVVRDGTLGSGPLEVGPGTDPLGQPADYLITPGMGKQSGGNLFHSFKWFAIRTGETATFTGPDPIEGPQSVSNVISRVTGGDASQIDGKLRSTIPGADVWLLNPSGIVFGAGAELDVKGSFHAGTGEYVGFEGGLDRFYSDPEAPSVLATASPAAFGFLPGGGAASLAVEGRLEVTRGEAQLEGADLTLSGAALEAPGAHLSLEATGEVELTDATVGGLSVPSLVDVGGETPGTISIRGGRILVEKGSQGLAENTGTGP